MRVWEELWLCVKEIKQNRITENPMRKMQKEKQINTSMHCDKTQTPIMDIKSASTASDPNTQHNTAVKELIQTLLSTDLATSHQGYRLEE